MPPVVMVESRPFEAGKRYEFALCFRIFRVAENLPVIEDHRVDGHEISCEIIDLELRRAQKLAAGESHSPHLGNRTSVLLARDTHPGIWASDINQRRPI